MRRSQPGCSTWLAAPGSALTPLWSWPSRSSHSQLARDTSITSAVTLMERTRSRAACRRQETRGSKGWVGIQGSWVGGGRHLAAAGVAGRAGPLQAAAGHACRCTAPGTEPAAAEGPHLQRLA